jgi:hypothetical protein
MLFRICLAKGYSTSNELTDKAILLSVNVENRVICSYL